MTLSTLRRCAPAAVLAVASATGATQPKAPLPPPLPWSGASEVLIAEPDDPWLTPAERDGFRLTPGYAETRQWLERLAAASPRLSMHGFGTSAEGRELVYVRASANGADADRPVVLIQAGIHAHEIDGKDAGLMLLRDIALRGKDTLIDAL
ncbi:MAG: M14 family zinc carboxypeptidase, partial [Pseudomonadota bacterium]